MHQRRARLPQPAGAPAYPTLAGSIVVPTESHRSPLRGLRSLCPLTHSPPGPSRDAPNDLSPLLSSRSTSRPAKASTTRILAATTITTTACFVVPPPINSSSRRRSHTPSKPQRPFGSSPAGFAPVHRRLTFALLPALSSSLPYRTAVPISSPAALGCSPSILLDLANVTSTALPSSPIVDVQPPKQSAHLDRDHASTPQPYETLACTISPAVQGLHERRAHCTPAAQHRCLYQQLGCSCDEAIRRLNHDYLP